MQDAGCVKSAVARRRSVVAGLVAAGALTLTLVTSGFASPSDPFKGAWTSTDTDGSQQRLSFGGSGSVRAVHYFDLGASVCGWPAIHASASLVGEATIDGSSATVSLAGQCNGTGQPLSNTVTFTYDSSTNTLADDSGVTWSR